MKENLMDEVLIAAMNIKYFNKWLYTLAKY